MEYLYSWGAQGSKSAVLVDPPSSYLSAPVPETKDNTRVSIHYTTLRCRSTAFAICQLEQQSPWQNQHQPIICKMKNVQVGILMNPFQCTYLCSGRDFTRHSRFIFVCQKTICHKSYENSGRKFPIHEIPCIHTYIVHVHLRGQWWGTHWSLPERSNILLCVTVCTL